MKAPSQQDFEFYDGFRPLVLSSEKPVPTAREPRRYPVRVDVSKLSKAFDNAKAKGLRFVKMRLLGNGIALRFEPAGPRAKAENVGAIYALDDKYSTYLGKIIGGRFMRSHACSDEQNAAVIAACGSPLDAAVAFGKKFGICSCCGRELSNELSVELGIGPICRGKFFG